MSMAGKLETGGYIKLGVVVGVGLGRGWGSGLRWRVGGWEQVGDI